MYVYRSISQDELKNLLKPNKNYKILKVYLCTEGKKNTK